MIEDYEWSKNPGVIDAPFYGLVMAAMRRADTDNAEKLRRAFPQVWDELQARYHAPGGIIPSDRDTPRDHLILVNEE